MFIVYGCEIDEILSNSNGNLLDNQNFEPKILGYIDKNIVDFFIYDI